jgi:hypothetical protein
MDNGYNAPQGSTNNTTSTFSNKNIIIILLVCLLVLSFLGINLIIVGGNFLQYIVNVFTPFFNQLFSLFGSATGTVINTSTDVITDTAKTTIDIAGGTLHSIGNLFQNNTQPVKIGPLQLASTTPTPTAPLATAPPTRLDISINTSPNRPNDPKPDTSANPIQNPITATKTQWCLVGEYEGRRGCIGISDADKCLSGQVYPDQKACLNPTFTNNMPPK